MANGFVPGTKCTCPASYILPRYRNGYGAYVVKDANGLGLEYHGNVTCYTLKSGAPNSGLLGNRWKE